MSVWKKFVLPLYPNSLFPVFHSDFYLRKYSEFAISTVNPNDLDAVKEIARWKTVIFAGSLGAIAILLTSWINGGRSGWLPTPNVTSPPESPALTRNPSVESPAQDPKVIEEKLALEKLGAVEKAATHAKFLARNLNPGFKRAAVPTLAVVSASSNGKLNPQLTSNLIRRLNTNGVEFVSSFFTPEFVADGNFKSLADGGNALISSLDLTNLLDGLVLAYENVTFEKSPELANVITASLELQISVIRFGDHNDRQSFSWRANGPGFREGDAQLAAEERIMKQIDRDTNFFLPPIHRIL